MIDASSGQGVLGNLNEQSIGRRIRSFPIGVNCFYLKLLTDESSQYDGCINCAWGGKH